MNSTPAIAIFDIGKTNKKLFVFDAVGVKKQMLLQR